MRRAAVVRPKKPRRKSPRRDSIIEEALTPSRGGGRHVWRATRVVVGLVAASACLLFGLSAMLWRQLGGQQDGSTSSSRIPLLLHAGPLLLEPRHRVLSGAEKPEKKPKDNAKAVSEEGKTPSSPPSGDATRRAAVIIQSARSEVGRTDAANERPPPKLPPKSPSNKKKGMWQMTALEQRAYLQSLHASEPGPSEAAALRFVEYASSRHVPRAKADERETTSSSSSSSFWGLRRRRRRGRQRTREPTIFIIMASYRDPEVASTIARAYARAKYPDRLSVGVHAQNAGGDAEPERDPVGGLGVLNVSCPLHPVCAAVAEGRVRVSRELWTRAEGPTTARARAELLFRNETFVAGLDSHCHFARHWDVEAIAMFDAIGNDHAIITAYPDAYPPSARGGDGLDHVEAEKSVYSYEPDPEPKRIGCIAQTRRVNLHTTVSFKHEMGTCEARKTAARVAFFAAGFSFSKGHRIARVPYDPHTPYVFDGEELALGVRAWTWGYDLYQPTRNVVAHLYIPSGSPLRPVFWTEDWALKWPCQFTSLLRVHRQLRIDNRLTPNVNPRVLDLGDWHEYDVGPRRDPRHFFEWARVRVANEWGDNCRPPPPADADAPDVVPGKRHCLSADLHALYVDRPGGMPYVPWKPGTEDLFPPLVRTDQYPPPQAEHWDWSPPTSSSSVE